MASITPVAFNDALSERYLAYALSTIMSRSLPDVRDGLKPVHRRLLYAMYELKLNPGSSFKKCARVVGDVMGKFHPHGDGAIYDALVRLAQDFSVRYPLIDGQGNFGNIDGDNAAAMRYTEARLTDIATLLFQGIDDDTVDFIPTYDSEGLEPAVFPAIFPNLLANGSSGIAVGMATNIPPHNLHELCQGIIALLDKPDLSDEALMTFVPGPDFPTGGLLVEGAESIQKSYMTGKGSFRLRARYGREEAKGGGYRLIITEIPYQVQKAKLLEKIADLMHQKKLPLLGNMLDESAEDMRIVLEPKSRNVDPEHLMESLYKQTDLDTRIPLNMNVLSLDRRPEVLSLKQILTQFISHRLDTLRRSTQNRLKHIGERLHLLDGLLIAYLNLDEVIRIIREMDEPKQELMKAFALSDIQAEAILNMRLRSLRKLQEIEIRTEHGKLLREQEELTALLGSEDKQKKFIKKECAGLSKLYGPETALGKRRTTLSEVPKDIDLTLLEPVEIEPITVVCSAKGWMRTLKGHVNPDDIKYKEGDEARFVLPTQSHLKVLIFTKTGRAYTLSPDKLSGGRGQGDALRLLVDMAPGDDIVYVGIVPLEAIDFILMNNKGRGFRVSSDNLFAQTKQGKQIMNCSDAESVVYCAPVTYGHVVLIGNHRKMLILAMNDIPHFARGQGVTLQKYKDGEISDVMQMNVGDGLAYRRGLKNVVEKNLSPWQGKRGSTGKLAPLGFPRSNKFE
ncbi:MAG: DNA topoisomerase IV subunit A [Alphaproteobacteria bacterium]|nr:DNA topoisomerase IV subunit A [Alphaproteobacteria bacterium]